MKTWQRRAAEMRQINTQAADLRKRAVPELQRLIAESKQRLG